MLTKLDFCTVADKNFAFKCLTLFNSIEKNMPGSICWVLCLDKETEDLFRKLGKEYLRIIAISDLHDKELEATKSNRTFREFAWTCKPAFMNFLLKEKQMETLVFADSDLLFYSTLDPIVNAHKESSVLLTSHKFSAKKAHLSAGIGYFNSGFIVFRNGETALACTKRYREQCIDWCYAYHDKGRHGDQAYLTDWSKRFADVEEIPEKGVNLGTWNLERYKITRNENNFLIDGEPLVCYHFHGLIVYKDRNAKIKPYPITIHHARIYRSYIQALQESYNQIIKIMPGWNYGLAPKPSALRLIKQKVTATIRNICR